MEFHSEKDLEQEQPNCLPQEDEEEVEEVEAVEEELCDSSFIVEGIDMNAHKAVLAACSAYFRAIFLHQKDMARKNTSKTTGWLLCVHFHTSVLWCSYHHQMNASEKSLLYCCPCEVI